MKTMGKIPARGFIARLYSATVPTVPIYGKNTLKQIFYQYPHSPAACKYEFFLKHVIYKNARGVHYYSQLLKIAGISPIVLLLKQSFLTPHSPALPPVNSILMYVPLKLTKPETTRDAFLQGFISFYFIFYQCLLNNKSVEQQSDPAHTT